MENKDIYTPYYEYDLDKLRGNLEEIREFSRQYNFHVHYAVKANYLPKIMETIKSYGLGADCVSGGEIECSLNNGFSPSNIVFAGVGKTEREIIYGLETNIACFNCESEEELLLIEELAKNNGRVAPVAIRVNPNIDAKTHPSITTGLAENKFGIRENNLQKTLELIDQSKYLDWKGLHFHIGSQITHLPVFKTFCEKVNQIQNQINHWGFKAPIINLGGGLGVDYSKRNKDSKVDYQSFFGLIHSTLKRRENQEVHFELGRSIIANCGKLISKVLYTKKGLKKDFVILDAGMTNLMRPALYGAKHLIEIQKKSGTAKTYDVVGPICESTDVFAKNISLPEVQRGDLVTIHTTGAYGECMETNYNLRWKNKAVFV
jgi:diaminopimelate decarboxylase